MRLLLPLLLLLIALALLWGPAGLDPQVVEAVRLPRVMGALVGGALLALGGLTMQTLLRNPLADPYILGVSGTAMLTALVFYILWRFVGIPYVGYFAGAVVGALAAMAAIVAVARRAGLLVVLVAGVLISYATGSAAQLILLALPPEELGYLYLGLQGSFAAFLPGPLGWAVAASALVLYAVAYLHARWIAAFIHGEESAEGLGADVKKTRVVAISVTSLGVGIVVASVGPVGFLGLLAPHMARWAEGTHRFDKLLLPAALWGAVLALASDLAVRALPREVPVNAVLSLIGAPAAAWLMWRYVRGV